MSLGDVQPRMSISNKIQGKLLLHFFYPTRQMGCMKYLKVSCCLFLKFSRNELRTSSKRPEKSP